MGLSLNSGCGVTIAAFFYMNSERWQRNDGHETSRRRMVYFLGTLNGRPGSYGQLSSETIKALSKIDEKWFDFWDEIFPRQTGDTNHRLVFLSSTYPERIVEKIEESEILPMLVANLGEIKYSIHENLGLPVMNYLNLIEDEVLFEWFENDPEKIVKFLNDWNSFGTLHAVLEGLIDSGDIYKVVNQGLSPKVFERFVRTASPQRVIREIDFYKVASKYIEDEESWETAFEVFGELTKKWGLAVSQKEIEDLMVEINAINQSQLSSDYDFKKRVMARKLLAPAEKKIRESYVVEYPSKIDRGLMRMDRRIREQKIDLLEDDRYVLAGLLPTLGYEIEHMKVGLPGFYYDLISDLGWNKGMIIEDNMQELSPGPFLNYKTAQYVFWNYWQAGFIDLHSAWGQSVHLNLGLKDMYGMIHFNRWLMATAWATFPKKLEELSLVDDNFYPADRKDQKLRIFYKNKDIAGQQYIESKEFCLTTPRNFLKFLRVSQLLSAGLMHLQLAMTEYKIRTNYSKSRSIFPRVEDEDWMNFDFETQAQAIKMSSLGDYQKEIALNYLIGAKVVEKGFVEHEVGGVISPFAPLEDVDRFMKSLRRVYPDHWSWYMKTSKELVGEGFFVGKEKYPNMVNFARRIALRVSRRNEELLERAKRDFEIAAKVVLSEKDKMKRLIYIRRMTKKFGLWNESLLREDEGLDQRVCDYLKMFVDNTD